MPFSQKISEKDSFPENNGETPFYNFNFKSSDPFWFLTPQKKTAEPYTQNWLGVMQEYIRKIEYDFKWENKLNAYCTPNRKNNLRFFYNKHGFTVEPRTTKVPIGDFSVTKRPGEIKYTNIPDWKVNFSLYKEQVGKGAWVVGGNRAEYVSGKVTVQYINEEKGMRQNFIVHSPLSNSNTLKIKFNISTKLKTCLKDNRLRFFHNKTNVLNYDQLNVWDAEGRSLKSSIKRNKKNKFYILVSTKGAVYPITIDPISTTPSAILESNQGGAEMGNSVSSAGDVNGDGYSDVIVGSHNFDNGQTNEGAAFIYHGSAMGISTAVAAMVESNQANTNFGVSVSSAGDVNGDGYSDVIIGANLFDNGQTDEGAAFVYHGSVTGINTTAAAMVESNQTDGQLGFSVASAGDVNSDGYSDVIAGAYFYDNGQSDEGAAFVYHGSVTGISSTAAALLESNQAGSRLGYSVAGAGDVNGDGYSDVIAGAYFYDSGQSDEGAAFVYHGSVTGINTTASVFVQSNQSDARLGYSVASAGDVNGDGYSDIITGAYNFDNGQSNEGGAFIYHGSAAGIITTAASITESNQAGAAMGISVACAGDINGDGYGDVIVGAYFFNSATGGGAAFIFQGSSVGINITATNVLEVSQAFANMGFSVSSAGDVNGDGYSDVISGAYRFSNGQSFEGAAFVYHGSAGGISNTPNTTVESNQANVSFGISVASAGDVNSDGYSDVIVGASSFDGGQFGEGAAFIYHGSQNGISSTPASTLESNQAVAFMGHSVASAGDVNGDGYSDVIVGVIQYDNGQIEEGAAFVYHGSVSGVNTTVASIVESNQTNAFMGISVASAGDVNGDGYSDIIVGAFYYANGQADEGAAFVYHGSAAGINITPAAIRESNFVQAFMGISVASAGDVNGDGYSDVIVGAHGFDNGQPGEGAAFVYHGSPTGIGGTISATIESNQAIANLGYSVSSAGDVNGDGYSDVIVGALYYDNGESQEGAAFVYHGSATGINTVAVTTIEGNLAGIVLGFSVASAGDVNGDGYSDVIAGAKQYYNGQNNEGAAFVYLGSVAGINPVASDTMESNQIDAEFGNVVACAGDVNGDGYSDVIAGAWLFDNDQINEGRAFLFNGNELTNNKRSNLRLYNSDLSTPINSSNFVIGNFGAGLFAKSFLGKIKGKLVWETRLNYNAYSGSPITNSTLFTSQQGTYTNLGLAGTELKNIIDKLLGSGRYTKLRARVKYDPVTAITGQVYGPWRNVSSVIDGNSLGALPIELVSFNVSWMQKGKIAKLSFITNRENGICCFDIEKSLDGFHFYSIGSLPARNYTGMQAYSFIDSSAINTKQFYRLKINRITRESEYSNIQQLQNNAATEILVFPNPTTDMLTLQLNKVYGKINVAVINVAGQVIKQVTYISTTSRVITISVKSLPAGQYWLRLAGDKERQILQFSKQ